MPDPAHAPPVSIEAGTRICDCAAGAIESSLVTYTDPIGMVQIKLPMDLLPIFEGVETWFPLSFGATGDIKSPYFQWNAAILWHSVESFAFVESLEYKQVLL